MAAAKENKYAQKWSEEEATERFLVGLEYAETDKKCLHLADAIKKAGIPYSTYDYLAEKHQVLGLIKQDTKVEVLRRINKGTLEGDFNPAGGIWRMKQLGETDSKDQNINFSQESIKNLAVTFIDGSKDS